MPSRRATLQALAAGVAALGGCAGGTEPSSQPTATTTKSTTTSPSATATTGTTTDPTTRTTDTDEPTDTPVATRCDERWNPNALWTVATEVRAYAPTVAGGTVYFGSQDHHLYAVDADSGHVEWRVEHLGGLLARPTVGDGVVTYVGVRSVAGFDAATGRERWSFAAPREHGKLTDTFGDDGDAVYVGASQHPSPEVAVDVEYDRVYALDRRTGERRWRISLDEVFGEAQLVPEAVAATDGRVFVRVEDGPLVALDARDGSVLWRHRFESAYRPLVTGGDTVYPHTAHELAAVDPATGHVRWTAYADAPPAVTSDAVFAVDDGGLRALDPTDGRQLWRGELPDGGCGLRPAVYDGTVYLPVGCRDGNALLSAFDATTGCRRGSFEVLSANATTPAVTDDAVFVGGLNGEGRMWAVSGP